MAVRRPDLAKRTEFGRPRCSEKLVPCIRSKSRNTREPCFDAAEIDRAKNSRQISTERAHGCVALAVRLDARNQEYCGAGEWRKNGLRNRRWIFSAGYAHADIVDLAPDLRNRSVRKSTPQKYANT